MGFKNYHHTEESKRKISVTHLGMRNGMFGKHSHNYLGIREDWLRKKYVDENLSGTDIAKIKNCNKTVIYYWLKRYGIPITKTISDYPDKFLKGNKNPNWKGGKTTSRGYRAIIISTGKYKFEHRIIMEKILGRLLEHYEVVHHLNGIKSDNRPENLVLMNKHNHDKYGKNYIEILQEKIRSLERELDVLRVGLQS